MNLSHGPDLYRKPAHGAKLIFMKQDLLLNKENWLTGDNKPRFHTWVKPYTIKELCVLYETSVKTFRKWLKPFQDVLGVRVGWYYSVRQVELIFFRLGVPYRVE